MPNDTRILVVDDETAVTSIICRALSTRGYETIASSSSVEALSLLRSQPFQLVITDLSMPGMDGLELLKRVVDDYPDTSVIMVTAHATVDKVIEPFRMGAADYMAKPISFDDLWERVDRVLSRRQSRLESQQYKETLEQQVQEQTAQIRAFFINALKSLAFTLEAKDPYTRHHSENVAQLALSIAPGLSLSARECGNLRLAGQLHDIGKIGVPEHILNKVPPLTEEEMATVRAHPLTAVRILSPLDPLKDALPLIKHHHERYDGDGYPDGLAGEAIPPGACILAVADAFDAMTSDRAYRGAKSLEEALSIIEEEKGSQFCPAVCDAFLDSLQTQERRDAQHSHC